ncbi:Uncharacterized protein Fot_42438 [Forsythia ovata]|uniref:Uncharacterized protein n=1 Tax=Forsythia ovata TaxID=205694 RepID=A0ABD1RLU2_9LAMI
MNHTLSLPISFLLVQYGREYFDPKNNEFLLKEHGDILAPTSTHISMEHVPGFSQALPPAHFQKNFGFFKSSQKETKSGRCSTVGFQNWIIAIYWGIYKRNEYSAGA